MILTPWKGGFLQQRDIDIGTNWRVWSETWRGGVGEIGAGGRKDGTDEMRVVLFVL